MDLLRDMIMNDNLAGQGDRHLSAAYEYIRASAGGTENAGPETITVEEGIDCREADSRFFNLCNRATGLKVIISKNSSILSCKLQDHEVVVSSRSAGSNQSQDHTWALADRPFQRMAALAWNCHVRGAELLLSASNGNSSMVYELNNYNELNVLVKLKSAYLQHQVTYFNLNNAKDKVPIDGHSLVVQCNGNLSRIQVHLTKLLNHTENRLLIPAQALVADLPYELVSQDLKISTNSWGYSDQADPGVTGNEDEALCDAIYSLESSSQLDFLNVRLQYNRRSLTFILRTASLQTNPSQQPALPQQTNVSSSTGTSQITSSSKRLNRISTFDQPSSSPGPSNSAAHSSAKSMSECSRTDEFLWPQAAVDESPLATSSTSHSINVSQASDNPLHQSDSSSPTPASIALSQPTTTLRARVRVTNFGVCIMPLMMVNYTCTYRFGW